MIKKHRLLAPSALTLAILCMSPLANAEVDAVVRQAQEAIAQGRYQQAYDTLEPHEVRRAGDPDFDLVFGQAANRVEQFPRAIMALERVVEKSPDNAQARAELGRALFAVKDNRAARALLQQARLQGIPVVAGESIDYFLQAVDRVEAEGQSSAKAFIEFGLGHDTNANFGPEQRNFAVPAAGGSLLVLNPSGIKTEANFAQLGGGASGRYIFAPRWSIVGSVVGSARAHDHDASQFDTLQIDGNVGLSYRVDREEFVLSAVGGIYNLDNDRVRNIKGVTGEWVHRFDGFRQLGAYVQLTRLEYPNLHTADVDRNVIGFTYANLFRSGFLIFGGLYAGKEKERDSAFPSFGHKFWGARLGMQQPLNQTLAVFGTFSYEDRKFGGTDPNFLVARHDRQTNASIGLNWVVAPRWRVTPQIAWTDNKSNTAISAYDKTTYSVIVRREF
jgi:outer membrane protein